MFLTQKVLIDFIFHILLIVLHNNSNIYLKNAVSHPNDGSLRNQAVSFFEQMENYLLNKLSYKK